MPRFVNWETPQGCGLGFQNSEQSRRIVSFVVEIEMLVQMLKNRKRLNYFNESYPYNSYSFDFNDRTV